MNKNVDKFPAGYLPMACPYCTRTRLEYGVNKTGGVVYIKCEKCGANSDDETLISNSGQ
jgi:transposase-like protein